MESQDSLGLAGFIAAFSIVLTLMFHTPTIAPKQAQQQQQQTATQTTKMPTQKVPVTKRK